MKKLFNKKNNKGFSLVELIVVVAIMAVLMAVLVPTLVRNVEKSRQQTDKTAIAELRQAIVNAIAEEKCLDASASTAGSTAASGKVMINALFGTAAAAEGASATLEQAANAAIIAEVTATIGADHIMLKSDYADSKLTLVDFQPKKGIVVMNIDSSKAKDFYIDAAGQHEGLFSTTAATQASN